MQKKDILSLNRDPDHIEGYVTIDYKDPDTGKVKERIEGKNHVFKDSFQASNWMMLLNNATVGIESFFITDDNSLIDDSFPYLKGNIIGWGRRGSAPVGLHLGEWWGDDSWSWLGNRNGGTHRQSYNFKSNQLQTRIGCVGLTAQYMNSTAVSPTPQIIYDRTLQPLRAREITLSSLLLSTGMGFSTHSFYQTQNNTIYVIVAPTVCQILKDTLLFNENERESILINPSNTPALSAVVTGTGYLLSVGLDESNGRAYIWAHHNTATNRRLYEFADDTFSELLNTYNLSNANWTQPTQQRAFAVRNQEMFSFDNTAMRVYDYINNIQLAGIWQGPNPCPYNNSILGSTGFGVFSKDKYVVFYTLSSGQRLLFIDTDRKGDAVERYTGSIGSMNNFGHLFLFEPTLESKPLIGIVNPSGIGGLGREFRMKQAFCAFTVPDDAPERQPGQTTTVSYQLDIHY